MQFRMQATEFIACFIVLFWFFSIPDEAQKSEAGLL